MELTAEKNVTPTVTNRIATIQLGNVLSSNRYLHVHCTTLQIALFTGYSCGNESNE